MAWMRARSALDPAIARSSASSDRLVRSAAALFASACSTARDMTSAFVAPALLAQEGLDDEVEHVAQRHEADEPPQQPEGLHREVR